MRERPILLNGDLVRAALNGSKTQTRRGGQMMQLTEEQKKALIADVNELREHLEFWGHASGFDAEFLIQVVDLCICSLNTPPVAALRLPPRAPDDLHRVLDGYKKWLIATTFRDTWNACLDEVKRLNATAPAEGKE